MSAISYEKHSLEIDGSSIIVYANSDKFIIGQAALLDWVENSARVVSDYYGGFPVEELEIVLNGYNDSGVRGGRAHNNPGLQVVIEIGYQVNANQLQKDWIMVHELIHLAMAELPDPHHWLEEGLPTYVESIARVQAGDLTEEFVWKGFIQGMPKGLPMGDDKGLDHTPTWGRTYWGGAMYCLLADIEIRRQTQMKLGLQQALRAVVEAGLVMDKQATMDEVLKVADERTGTSVMRDLYDSMKDTPKFVDLHQIWAQLGITVDDQGNVSLDNSAPLAPVRLAIFSPEYGASKN